jgi:hypothetical protein
MIRSNKTSARPEVVNTHGILTAKDMKGSSGGRGCFTSVVFDRARLLDVRVELSAYSLASSARGQRLQELQQIRPLIFGEHQWIILLRPTVEFDFNRLRKQRNAAVVHVRTQ